jgi:hypothetical protein
MQKWISDYLTRAKPGKKPNDINQVYKNILRIITLVTLIIFLCFYFYFQENGIFEVFTILSVLGAFYLGGCAIGFLFAIPKSVQRTQFSNVESVQKGMYNDNTNLEEISDWLTKIIVGVSLTQFNQLRIYLQSAAEGIGAAIKSGTINSSQDFYVFSYCIIVFYAIAGMIIGYMWSRIDFPKILTQNQRDISEIERLQEKNAELNEAVKEQKQSLVKIINDPSAAEIVKETNNEEIEDPSFRKLIKEIGKSRAVKDKGDWQKGRWGGASEANGRCLSVEVAPSAIPSLYKVRIQVKAIDNIAFTTPVAILLHDTFKPEIRLLDANGKTSVLLEVISYEAFTVAALTDVKSITDFTALELDINELPKLPPGFYW